MAYSFNGSNQSLSVDSSPVGNSPATLTIAFWVKGNMSGNTYYLALSNASNNNPVFGFTRDSNSARLFGRNDAGSNFQIIGTSPIFGASAGFAHIAATYQDGTQRLYVNGSQEGTQTATWGTATLNRLGVGAWIRSGSIFSASTVAEVSVWDVVLTANEVASLSKGFTATQICPQSLKFYAPLVRDLIDVKGGLTITNNNTATVAAHPRVYA